jgi:hypothetical protein
MAQNDPELLARLQRNGLEFVIIGGVCCIYYGVTLATFDLDICCRFDEPNLRRIERAVSDLHPYHRLATNKLPLELTSELCSRLKNLYLQTDLGKLDVLGEVAGVGPSGEVLRRSQKAKLSYGEFRFMTIDALMDAKEAAGRERDLIALKHLRPIKERLEQKGRNLKSEI